MITGSNSDNHAIPSSQNPMNSYFVPIAKADRFRKQPLGIDFQWLLCSQHADAQPPNNGRLIRLLFRERTVRKKCSTKCQRQQRPTLNMK